MANFPSVKRVQKCKMQAKAPLWHTFSIEKGSRIGLILADGPIKDRMGTGTPAGAGGSVCTRRSA